MKTNILKRLLCHINGCTYGEDCERCGADLYGGDHIEIGWLDPLRLKWWQFKRTIRGFLRANRCNECGKLMSWAKRNESCCSEECYERYIPF